MSGMDDAGFLDSEGARRAVRRIRLRYRLIEAQELISALLDRLAKPGNPVGDSNPAGFESGVALTGGNSEGCVGGDAVRHVKSKDVGEQELLQGADLVLQFLDTLFEGLGHGAFSTAGVRCEAIAAPIAPESKKGVSK